MVTLDGIDDAPTSAFHRRLLIACSGGPFLDGYVLSLIGVALVGFGEAIPSNSVELGLIGASSLVGIFFGAVVFGALTDRIGREKMYALDLTVLVVACALSAFVTDAWQLILLRFIIGLAVGADYPIATSLLTEFTPRTKRGFMIGVSGLAWSIGAMFAFVVAYVMVNVSGGHQLWRWMLFSGAIVGLIVVLLRRGIPESPRWLASKGRFEEADRVMKLVYGPDATLPEDASAMPPSSSFRSNLATIVRGGYLKRIVMCGTLYFAQITPQYALYTYGAIILTAAGIEGDSASTVGELVIAALFAVGIVASLRPIESWGRRPMTIWPLALMALSLLALGFWRDAPSWFVMGAFAFFAFINGGPSLLLWIYPNELFPTQIRATAVGIAVGVSRLGAATGTYLLPISIASIGLENTVLIAAGLVVSAFFVCFAWSPETTGRSLAETSSLDAV